MRLRKAAAKDSEKYKKRRQILRQQRKNKKKDKTYKYGGFSTKTVPDNIACKKRIIENQSANKNSDVLINGDDIPIQLICDRSIKSTFSIMSLFNNSLFLCISCDLQYFRCSI